MTWRCKFVASTVSSSTMPIVPTPAAARYCKAGAPRPPAPITKTPDCRRRIWPEPPISGMTIWRAYRSSSVSDILASKITVSGCTLTRSLRSPFRYIQMTATKAAKSAQTCQEPPVFIRRGWAIGKIRCAKITPTNTAAIMPQRCLIGVPIAQPMPQSTTQIAPTKIIIFALLSQSHRGLDPFHPIV